jgi:hypothetical protein
MLPIVKTRAERMEHVDQSFSLEERYKDHDGYVVAVRKAAANAVEEGSLLQPDPEALIVAAIASDVLKPLCRCRRR